MNQNCDSCGARLSPDAEVCDLCGTPTGFVGKELAEDHARASDESADSTAGPGVCPECGHVNPDTAAFCNQCGAKMGDLADGGSAPPSGPAKTSEETVKKGEDALRPPALSPKPGSDSSQSAIGKQVIIVVSAALLLVMALYVITSLSDSASVSSETQSPANLNAVEPLAQQWIPRQEELQAEVSRSIGADQIAARRNLIDLYFAADRLDMAADETGLIAEATASEQEWTVAGNLYFDWMQRQPDVLRATWAQKAIGAYQKALDMNPMNLDVRTDMAIAYMYDPQNSMMAIQETNKVLEQDSLHIQANFNRGIMLSQINRTEQAIEQFEKVKRIVGDENDPVYLRAVDAVARLSGMGTEI